MQFQRTYDALLAAPVDTEEIVTAEALWIARGRARLRVRPVAGGHGLRARSGVGHAARPVHRVHHRVRLGDVRDPDRGGHEVDRQLQLRDVDGHHAAVPAGAGTFFPITGLPEWAQVAAELNPLYHCVQLVRDACFGFKLVDVWHLGFLVVFGLAMWRLAISRMERKLID